MTERTYYVQQVRNRSHRKLVQQNLHPCIGTPENVKMDTMSGHYAAIIENNVETNYRYVAGIRNRS